MARICIITPGQLGSNPRVVKEANALAEAGHAVTVICTKVLASVEPRDQAVIATARFKVHRIAFGQGLGWRIDRLVQIAARRLFALWPNRALAERAVSPMARRLRHAAGRQPAELYIAHYPAALPAAARAAARHHTRYAFDAEDFYAGDLPDAPQYALETSVIAAIERSYLPAAIHVTAASPGIADAYAGAYGVARPSVVLNTFPKAQAPDSPAQQAARPSLYWFSQTLGPGRGLETLLEAVAQSRSQPHVHLRGMPSANYAEALAALATSLGVADRLHLLDPIEPDLLERAGADHDIGYVGELAETPNRQIALTNKLFSYLSSGLAVLASDIPAHRAIAPELGGAIKLFRPGDAAALAACLDDWLDDRPALQAARISAWTLGQTRYSWETDKATLVRRVAESLGSPSKPGTDRVQP